MMENFTSRMGFGHFTDGNNGKLYKSKTGTRMGLDTFRMGLQDSRVGKYNTEDESRDGNSRYPGRKFKYLQWDLH